MPYGNIVKAILEAEIPWQIIDKKCNRLNPIESDSKCAQLLQNIAKKHVSFVDIQSELLYKQRIKSGHKSRHKTHLCSAQVRLSQIRTNAMKLARKRWDIANTANVSDRTLRTRKNKLNAFTEYYTKGLRLSPAQLKIVKDSRQQRVEKADVVTVDADRYVQNATDLLKFIVHNRGDMFEAVVAIALLTGRRSSEIMKTAIIEPVTDAQRIQRRETDVKYWGKVSGFLKHKPGSCIVREVPMLAPRELICKGIQYVRSFIKPSLTVDQLNKTYASRIQARVHKLCPELKTLHTLRKFFSLVAHHYFKLDVKPGSVLSLPQFASHVLGHTRLSDTVITYLNFNINSIGSLSYV